MQEFLEWTRTGQGVRYAVNSVEVNGAVKKDRALLTAIVTVQIAEENRWVLVPLAFNEGNLRSKKYEFLGEQPGVKVNGKNKGEEIFASLTRDAGYQWWFKGKGYHRLTLSLLVPLGKLTPERRLKLTMPRRMAASELKLTVPISAQRLSVTRQQGTPPTIKPVNGQSTEIRLFGLGNQLDLKWRELPPQRTAGKILRVESFLLLKLTEESVVLTVEQQVQALKGSFSSIEVQLPSSFQLISVEGKHYENHRVDPKTGRVTVELSEPRTELTKLVWKLHRKFPMGAGKISIEGFQVSRARYQSGEIALQHVQGIQFTKREEESRSVDRIRVSSFRGRDLTAGVELAAAYSILQQPFQLHLNVSRIAPQVSVEPRFTLRFSERQLELSGELRVQISDEGGALQHLDLDWPSRQPEGWKNITIGSASLVESVELNPKKPGLPIRVHFLKPQTGEVVLPVKATRDITADGSPLAITLPAVLEATQLPTTLISTGNIALDVKLSARNETVLVETKSENPLPTVREFELQPEPHHTLSAAVTRQERKILTETTLHASLENEQLAIKQRLQYQVSYAFLPEIRLSIPNSLVKDIRVRNSKGDLLAPISTGLNDGENTEMTFPVPGSQTGLMEFLVEYSIPLKTESSDRPIQSLKIPLVRSTEAPFRRIRFRLSETGPFEATLEDPAWETVQTADQQTSWQTEQPATTIPLQLRQPTIPRSSEFSIQRALIASHFDLQGGIRSRAQYRLESPPGSIVFQMPARTTLESIWWGRKKITPTKKLQTSDESTIYRIVIPELAENGSGLLTIDYHTTASEAYRWLGTHEMVAPVFPQNVWIQQSLLRITLPKNYHLFSQPSGFTPQFQWQRGTLFFSRQPTMTREEIATWISSQDGPPARDEFVLGNSYLFSQFGPVKSLTFHSMNRSLIVLFGAGIAWILGVLMVKLPVMRSVAAILSVMLIMAVVAVWYLVQVQVLMQSSILGLLIAGLFLGIERRVKRQQSDSAVLTISRPSDFFGPGVPLITEGTAQPPLAGSEDVTALRPGSSLREPISSSDLHGSS
ncbi:MAG: hypothetical protein Tsb009_17560 [Planctomycetaceae bacterium]